MNLYQIWLFIGMLCVSACGCLFAQVCPCWALWGVTHRFACLSIRKCYIFSPFPPSKGRQANWSDVNWPPETDSEQHTDITAAAAACPRRRIPRMRQRAGRGGSRRVGPLLRVGSPVCLSHPTNSHPLTSVKWTQQSRLGLNAAALARQGTLTLITFAAQEEIVFLVARSVCVCSNSIDI